MKATKLYISIFICLVGLIGYSQTPNRLLEDPNNKIIIKSERINIEKNRQINRVEQNNSIDEFGDLCADCDGLCNPITGECFDDNNPPPPLPTISKGTTSGEFGVSLSGAATYNVPISLPSGIRDIAPSVGLSFSSQASNGLAGWGWNISGLSTITRIPSTKYHDDNIDGVDFDSYDRFALDGQRLLLKNGTYGAANSEYQTENYSNLRILAYGTSPYGASYGPSYFIVFYPDGTKAYYGNGGGSLGRLEWALHKREDPQGNYIQYDYLKSNELLRISSIKYGAKGSSTSPNVINFYYKTRIRPELSYINGIAFKRTNILDRIEVNGGSQLFRKYQITHNPTSLGYERISSITEYNSDNQSFPAITFSYENSSNIVNRDGNTLNIYPGIDYRTDAMTVGELDGDGKMDIITYNKNTRDKLNVFMDMFSSSSVGIGYTIQTEKFDDVFTSTILSWNGKLLQQQGITTVSETVNNSNSNVRFRTSAMASYGPVFQYDKTVDFPIGPIGNFQCDEPLDDSYRKIKKSYISGDFNGDGLTDVIAIENRHTTYNCFWEDERPGYDPYCDCVPISSPVINANVYFVDIKRTDTTSAINIGTLASDITSFNDKLYGVDFDGDGKTDLMHIKNGSVKVYSMNSNNQLVEIATLSNSNISIDKPIVLGDYNGDGKIDFTIPSANNNSTWHFYLSLGNSFHYYAKNIGITYTENYVHNGNRTVNGVSMSNPFYEYHYIAQDYNGDGKSDILKHEVVSPYSSYNVVSDRLQLYENKFNPSDTSPSFLLINNSLATNNGVTKFGIPIFLEAKTTNNNLEYAYIDGNNVHTYEFKKDHKKDITLNKITNNGIVTDVFYERLDSDYGSDMYSFDYEENYPYININVAPSLALVKEATHTASTYIQRQLYQYKGSVSHAEGLGFLGFKVVRRTNWFGDGVGTLWNISKHDMQKRGAVTQQYVSTSSSDIPYNFVNKTDYTYATQLLSNKVFINVPTQIIKNDGLQGISSTENYTYDAYQNPLTISNSYPGGSKTISFEYTNNPSAINEQYHIGRPTKKTEVSLLNGNSFGTEIQFTYNNNLVTEIKNKGNGTPWLSETFLHDAFGNIVQKTISGDGISDRAEAFQYDLSGRYMTKSIDVLGLETTFTYDTATGNPLTQTSPYGQTTTFVYDKWQRVVQETNFLGKSIYYTYGSENISGIGECLTKTVDFPDGQDQKTYYNAFGWVVQSKVLSLNNQWIQKRFEYDAIGRQTKESEPYFANGSPTQWNQTYYDEYGRPISHSLFTGKVINTTYSGLSVTVNDGTKTVTTTKDALGNITTLQDTGGTINYQYYGNGVMKSANYGTHTVSTTIDGWGRKASLTDPSAGTYTYEYNILGESTIETTPKGITEYEYDDYGRITRKEISGDQTALTSEYRYHPTTKLLLGIDGLNERGNGVVDIYNYEYEYDSHKRLNKITETNNLGNFEKQLAYDGFGRILSEHYITNHIASATNSTIKVKNIYDAAGIPIEIRDFNTNKLLWKVNQENARGQVLSITLGNGMVKSKVYDQYGFLTNITDKDNITNVQALKMDYSFNAERGILNSRKNYGFVNWDESFTHDNFDRLTHISGAVTETKSYDDKGRITNNSAIGDYSYNPSSTYRLDTVDLNNQGDLYYQQHSLQQITYNAFKKPIEIFEENKGRVSFEYGPMMNRTQAFYGGLQTDKWLRQYHKMYSSIIPVEIVADNVNNSTKIITYIGGDAYTAPIAHIKQVGGTAINAYHYLHRDYLGSILAITNTAGTVLEQRQFGAWGTTDKFVDSQTNTTFGYSSLINRGFTGHEHFFDVALIHMNGRMYDAQLGRFLSPDNYIQDPFNTQSFNRYGYVWNNPLSFNDANGEFIVAAIIGAAIGVITNGINNTINGKGFFVGAGQAAFFGAIGGAASFGIGQMASSLTTTLTAAGSGISASSASVIVGGFQAAAHATLGGTLSIAQGGKFGAGALSGAISSIVASSVTNLTLKSEVWETFVKVGSAGASGGIGSVIAGGNFWDGVRQGLISGGLNHGVHAGWFGPNMAAAAITQKIRHLWGPDALQLSGSITSAFGIGTKMEKGEVFMLRGKDAITLNGIDGAAGVVGLPTLSAEISVTRLYYSGSVNSIEIDVFTGVYHQVNVGVDIGLSVGGSIAYSPLSNRYFTIGIGVGIGFGVSPVYGLDANYQYGTTGTNGPFKNN